MLVFVAIAIGAFIILTGSFLFGHDHEVNHDHDAGHDHDHTHDAAHGDVGGDEPTISIFSTKVLGTLLMGFGAAGAIARYYGMSYLMASLMGIVCGLLLSGLMYLMLGVFYKQQASSLVSTASTVGCRGTVTVSIGADSPGEVGLSVDGQYLTYAASSNSGAAIPKGQQVRVLRTMGSHVIVEQAS